MKISRILILIFGLCIVFSTVTFAKSYSGLDMSNPSVQLLQKLNDDGKQARQNDLSIEMPDISKDTNRTAQKKLEFENTKKETFPSLYKVIKEKNKKNPDNNNYRGE